MNQKAATNSDGAIDVSELPVLWRLSFQNTTRGICITDADTEVFRAVNPAFARMHGGSPSDFVGRPADSVLTPTDAARLPARIAEVEREGFIAFEAENIRLDGSTFPTAIEGVTILDENGVEQYKIGWVTDLSARSELERRRREAQRQFEAAFAQASVGVALVRLDGRGLRANPAFCQITGYSEQELQKLDFGDFTHPDDLEATLEADRRLFDGQESSYRLEKRYIRRDGSHVWVGIVVSLIADDDGVPVHFLVHAIDLSLRKRVEEELTHDARGEGLERDLMCVTTADGTIERLEGDWEAVFECSEGEIRDRNLLAAVHPNDRKEAEAALGELAAGPESWKTFSSRWKTGDGAWSTISWSAFGLEGGRIFWSARTIDDRLSLERAFELRGQVIETMAEGVCLITAADLRIAYANPSFERMFGYGPGELAGRDASAAMRPLDLGERELAELAEARAEMLEQGRSVIEARCRRRDDSDFWARMSGTTFEHPRFGAVWVSIVEDITEERRLQDAAAELELAKTRFLSAVSHELRTPLTSIVGYAAMLRSDADERTGKQLQVIERNAERQLRLVEDLLSIARIEAGEFEVLALPVDLAVVAAESVEQLRPSALDSEVEIVAAIEAPLPTVGDPDRLGQVVGNLLANAIKFTPPGGSIELTLHSEATNAILRVADAGPGIAEEFRERVFDRLYSSEAGSRRGAGIGLTIARSIVEAHGGTIRALECDRGALFEVLLPLSADPSR